MGAVLAEQHDEWAEARPKGKSGGTEFAQGLLRKLIIARRTGLLSGLSPAAKPRQASDRPHVRLAGAGVAFRNCTTSRDRNAGDQWIGIHTYPLDTNPLHPRPRRRPDTRPGKAQTSHGVVSLQFR